MARLLAVVSMGALGWWPQAAAQEGLKDYQYWAGLCRRLPPRSASMPLAKPQMDQYDAALKACDQAIALNASDPQTWTDRGSALLALGQSTAAVAAFDQALKLNPDHPPSLAQRCVGLFQEKQYQMALQSCEAALMVADRRGTALPKQAWYYRGAALLQLKQFDAAVVAYDWAVQLNPEDGRAWADRCQAQTQLRQYAQALADCDLALQTGGTDLRVIALRNRGDLHQQRQHYHPALADYNQALALAPNNADLWIRHGITLRRLGRNAEAQNSFKWALKTEPKSALALVNLCITLNRLGQHQQALEHCEQALEQNQQSPQTDEQTWGPQTLALAWMQRGNALLGLGRFEEALASIDRAIAVAPRDVRAWSNRAVALWRLGRFQDALAATEQATTINDQSSQAWFNRGRILTTMGQLQDAEAAYQLALQGDAKIGQPPTLAEIWVNQSSTLWRLERYTPALQAAQQATRINPELAAAWYNQALALMALGSNQKALSAYDQALAIAPKQADYWVGKGIALRHLKQYKAALAALQQALMLAPDHPLARVNQAQIETILKSQ